MRHDHSTDRLRAMIRGEVSEKSVQEILDELEEQSDLLFRARGMDPNIVRVPYMQPKTTPAPFYALVAPLIMKRPSGHEAR